jgi:hypothetical protein
MSDTSAMPVPAETASAGHEDPSVDTRGVLMWAAGLLAAIVFGCLAAHWAFVLQLLPSEDVSMTPQNGQGMAVPAEPRLEGIEMMSRAPSGPMPAPREQLNKYGWVDREKGVVHIPIDRAMELVVERRLLPSKAEAPTQNEERPPLDPNTVSPIGPQP